MQFKSLRLNTALLNIIFVPVIFFLLGDSLLSFWLVRKQMEINQSIVKSYEIVQSLDRMLYNLMEIESHQKGYFLSREPHFLVAVPYHKESLKRNLSKFMQLASVNEEEARLSALLKDLLEQRLIKLEEEVHFYKKNQLHTEEGIDILEVGQEISNKLIETGKSLRSMQLTLLGERNLSSIDVVRRVSWLIIISTLLVLFILLTLYSLLYMEMSKRILTENSKSNVQSWLEGMINSIGDMIAAVDVNKKFVLLNDAYQEEFKRAFGKSIKIGSSLDDVFESAPEYEKIFHKIWSSPSAGKDSVYRIQYEVQGIENSYEITSSAIQNKTQDIIGIVHVMRNISARVLETNKLQDSNEQLKSGMLALEEKNKQITTLIEMCDIMLACSSQGELCYVLSEYCQQVLGFSSGCLYIIKPFQSLFELSASWGEHYSDVEFFSPEQCWSVKLGHEYKVDANPSSVVCDHLKTIEGKENFLLLCVPLIAQGDAYGVLSLLLMKAESEQQEMSQKLLVSAFCELLSVSLANIRLRDSLLHQSIRDPLTGLYNRRHLEEFIQKRIYEYKSFQGKNKVPFSLLMLDVDYFKKINDVYGHDAGDSVLKEVSHILRDKIRSADTVFRFGGEEFVVLLGDADQNGAKLIAEHLRKSIASLHIKYGAQQIPSVTVSIGVAEYPADAETVEGLIKASDKALYAAKSMGRNCWVLYSSILEQEQEPPLK